MDIFNAHYLGNSFDIWLSALGVTVAVLLLFVVAKRILVNRFVQFAEKTKTQVDDLFADLFQRVRYFFLIAVSLYAGSIVLTLPPTVNRIFQGAILILVLFQTAIWGNAVISFWLSRTMKKRIEEDAASATTLAALGFISRLVLWAVILLVALANLGVDITALVAGLGLGGIAVALALQNILGDLFASLSIVLDKPFVIGDFIIVGDYLGSVEYIGLKTTRIRSLSGEQVVFSNSDLLKSRIRNYKRMFERRVVFGFGVTYQTPYEKVAAIPSMVKKIIERQPYTRFDRAHFKEYGDSSLNYEAVYYVKSPDFNTYMDTQQTINLELFKQLAEQRIDFAYPTRTVVLTHEGNASPASVKKSGNKRRRSGVQKNSS